MQFVYPALYYMLAVVMNVRIEKMLGILQETAL